MPSRRLCGPEWLLLVASIRHFGFLWQWARRDERYSNHRDDGFGEVYPLIVGQRCTLGRAATCQVVVKDELCSREHAEISFTNGHWCLRDLGSLNGTRLNNTTLDSEWELSPGDDVNIGRSHFVFVHDMSQLPDVPLEKPGDDGLSIKKRLGQTRFLTPEPPGSASLADVKADTTAAGSRHSLSRTVVPTSAPAQMSATDANPSSPACPRKTTSHAGAASSRASAPPGRRDDWPATPMTSPRSRLQTPW